MLSQPRQTARCSYVIGNRRIGAFTAIKPIFLTSQLRSSVPITIIYNHDSRISTTIYNVPSLLLHTGIVLKLLCLISARLHSQTMDYSHRPNALPSHMTNGSSPLHTSRSVRDERERQTTFDAIRASMGPRREPVDLDGDDAIAPRRNVTSRPVEAEAARDPRDEAPPTPPAPSTRC